jgi:hypothetical protein
MADHDRPLEIHYVSGLAENGEGVGGEESWSDQHGMLGELAVFNVKHTRGCTSYPVGDPEV